MANNKRLETGNGTDIAGFMEAPPRINEWRRFLRVFFARGMVAFGLVVLVLMIFVAIFAGWIAPYSPFEIDLRSSLAQPSADHLLGTDNVGRDSHEFDTVTSNFVLLALFYSFSTASGFGNVQISYDSSLISFISLWESLIGLFMAVAVLARFVSLLPDPPDENTKGGL